MTSIPKLCVQCNEKKVSSPRAKYCSESCKQKSKRGVAPATPPAPTVPRIDADFPEKPAITLEEIEAQQMEAQTKKAREAMDRILKKRGLASLAERAKMEESNGFLTTGFTELDMLISNGEIDDDGKAKGGFPINKLTEIFGRKGIGKSTIMSKIARHNKVQTFYVDTEGAFNPESVPPYVTLVRESILENVWGLVNDALDSGVYRLIVVDSIAGTTTLAEQSQDNEVSGFSTSKSKILNQWMRGLTSRLVGSNTALVFTNQIRDSLSAFGASEYIPGGNAIPFYASLRIALHSNASDRIMVNGIKTGHKITAKLDKSRFGPDQVKTQFTLKFGNNS